jgi:hypothetical protein
MAEFTDRERIVKEAIENAKTKLKQSQMTNSNGDQTTVASGLPHRSAANDGQINPEELVAPSK